MKLRPFDVVNLVMAALFLASAALQYNDPDPGRWILVYGGAALACVVTYRDPRRQLLPAVFGGLSLIWGLTLVPQMVRVFRFGDLFRTMKAETPSIELSRETLGLLIIAAWMGVLLVRARQRET